MAKSKKTILIISIVAIFIYLGITGKISFSSQDSAIAKNATMQGMFKQSYSSSDDKKEAEQSFISKYFNINF